MKKLFSKKFLWHDHQNHVWKIYLNSFFQKHLKIQNSRKIWIILLYRWKWHFLSYLRKKYFYRFLNHLKTKRKNFFRFFYRILKFELIYQCYIRFIFKFFYDYWQISVQNFINDFANFSFIFSKINDEIHECQSVYF